MAAYLLGMPSIWELGYRPGESALSGLTVALMMPVGIVAMTLTHSRATWTAGFLTTLIYAAATTLFLLAIWDADHWRSSERLAMSALTVLGFGAFAIACSIHAGMSDGRFWRWIGVAAAILAAGLTLVGIWQRTSGGEDTIVIIASVAAVIGHANLALLAPLRPGQSWWRYATIATGICTAIALDIDLLAAMGTNRHGITITGRIALASGILWSTGTLGLLILTRLNRSPVAISPDAPLLSIDLRCPRCGKRQVVAVGNSRCSDCDLGFHIALDSTTKLTEMAESGNQGDHDLQNLAESHHAES